MIGVALIGQIRRAYFEQHRSIKEGARIGHVFQPRDRWL
jgi:hypothetical protein